MLIYDLDGTVIDSSHRQLADSQGNLDLAHWREHSTPEKIAKDSLLPLAQAMRHALANDQSVIICTARVLGDADRAYLREHGLDAPVVLSRDGDRDNRPDAQLKREKLLSLGVDLRGATMYDDNQSVLAMARELGINAVDATIVNEALS
jgi:FMN phosphatase YigB (HAD superfamily)